MPCSAGSRRQRNPFAAAPGGTCLRYAARAVTERIIQGDRAVLGDALARELERAAAAAIGARGRFTVALTGGSTAKLYEPLVLAPAMLACTHFWFGDERAVPPDHPDSNYALARRALLDRLGVPPERVHRMRAENADLDHAARAYEKELGNAALDVVMLGVGPDGHVASLFPGHALLAERARRVAWLDDSPKPPPRRLTFTLRALAEAREVWLFAMGAEKVSIVRRALVDRDRALPAALAAEGATAVTWFLDDAAAAGLV